MLVTYYPKDVCSKLIKLDVEDGVIRSVEFLGGCAGNAKGISALVKGRPVNEVIETLRGIRCGSKRTSCPDQLALALEEIQDKAEQK